MKLDCNVCVNVKDGREPCAIPCYNTRCPNCKEPISLEQVHDDIDSFDLDGETGECCCPHCGYEPLVFKITTTIELMAVRKDEL
jgi:hypothetical protein